MGKKENTLNKNNKDEYHGYQQWYTHYYKIWLRGCFKNDAPIGYHEANTDSGGIGDEGTQVEFYIK
jgi:hypothetical protein